MKKKLSAIPVLLLLASALWAGTAWKLDIISFDPLHEPYAADRYGANLAFNYLVLYDGYPGEVWQENGKEEGGTGVYPLEYGRFRARPGMAQFRLAETFTFLRNTFTFGDFPHPLSWDVLTLQGGASIVFDGEISDLMGYDGCYFVGTAFSLSDRISVRFGLTHRCTHYGDAVMNSIEPRRRAVFDIGYRYLRNDLTVGLSVRPVPWLRLYGEYEWLPEGGFLKPAVFRPDHGRDAPGWGKDYRAAIAAFGIELSYPFWKGHGNTRLSYDLHLYEEGRIVLREDGRWLVRPADPSSPESGEIHFDPGRPWNAEHSLVFSQDFTDWFSFEMGWHTGRSPLGCMFAERDAGWVHIGMRFDPSLTCTVCDTSGR